MTFSVLYPCIMAKHLKYGFLFSLSYLNKVQVHFTDIRVTKMFNPFGLLLLDPYITTNLFFSLCSYDHLFPQHIQQLRIQVLESSRPRFKALTISCFYASVSSVQNNNDWRTNLMTCCFVLKINQTITRKAFSLTQRLNKCFFK